MTQEPALTTSRRSPLAPDEVDRGDEALDRVADERALAVVGVHQVGAALALRDALEEAVGRLLDVLGRVPVALAVGVVGRPRLEHDAVGDLADAVVLHDPGRERARSLIGRPPGRTRAGSSGG
jgi:hypothetical protein